MTEVRSTEDGGDYMRHNFVNDIGDYAKYALLRALCTTDPDGINLGVIWYLTEHEESNSDGRKRPHLSREGWDALDAQLLTKMRGIEKALQNRSDLHLDLIENGGILPPDTAFFSEALPSADIPARQRNAHRIAWFGRAHKTVEHCSLVFLDPDNGLEPHSGNPSSVYAGKYVRVREMAALLTTSAGVVLYQHCDRSPWRVQRERILNQLTAGVASSLTIRSLRFGAFGARAFICISNAPDMTETFESALNLLRERTASSDMARYLLIE